LDGYYHFRLNHPALPEEPLLQSYDDGGTPGIEGAKCDHHWLSDYGFLPGPESPDEAATCVPLSIRLPLDSMPPWKQGLLHQSGLLGMQTSILEDGEPSNATMALLRAALLDAVRPDSVTEIWHQHEALLEMQVLNQLARLIKMLLKEHPHDIDKDVAALQNGQLTTNRRLALRYRIREKRNLEAALKRISEKKKGIQF